MSRPFPVSWANHITASMIAQQFPSVWVPSVTASTTLEPFPETWTPGITSIISNTNLTHTYVASAGDGSTTNFDITNTVTTAESVDVFVNAIVQRPNVDYTVSSSTLTFTSPPGLGVEVEIRNVDT